MIARSPHEHPVRERARRERLERPEHRRVGLAEGAAGVGRDGAAGGGGDAGDEVGLEVAVEVFGGDADAAAAGGVAGEEVGDGGLLIGEQFSAIEDFDAGRAAGAGTGDYVRDAVAVDVADGHERTVAQRLFVGEKIREGMASECRADAQGAVVPGDAGAAAEARGDDEVGEAIAGDVADGSPSAAAEVRVFDAEEVEERGEIFAAEDPHAGAAALVGGHDHIGPVVAVEVARGHENAAGEGLFKRPQFDYQGTGAAVVNPDAGRDAWTAADEEIIDAIAGEVGPSDADAAGELGSEGEGLFDRGVRRIQRCRRTGGVRRRGHAIVERIFADGEARRHAEDRGNGAVFEGEYGKRETAHR